MSREEKLESVFWLGGSPCSGKTSISEVLCSRFDLNVYHVDEAFQNHTKILDPVRHPALTKWFRSSWEERWMQPVDDLVHDAIACYQEHFALIREDLLAMPKQQSLLVEGTVLLPRDIATIFPNRNQAIWLIPTSDFQRDYYSQRAWVRGVVEQCSNADVAFNNWMERDVQFAKWIEAEVAELNLQLLKVDGTDTLETNAEVVASHFQLN